nr:MAG TPA: hypothetical protein [Caudoviricetes sp.]
MYVCSIKYPLQILPLAIASDFCNSKSTCLCKLKFKAITSYV